MQCRLCGKKLGYIFVSLGRTPLSNAYLAQEQLTQQEAIYPLDVYVCSGCFLVQLPEFEKPENIFTEYAYFSSYSDMWLKHAKDYVKKMISRFALKKDSFIVEIASNDGYLLQYFLKEGFPVLGIEPAENVAAVAVQKGVPTEVAFFGKKTADRLAGRGRRADLILGNNVLAHVPDLNDFVEGLKVYLNDGGIITMEFPHLLRLVEGVQFDTIYHEHFSYFSFLTAEKAFVKHGLKIFDVDELPTHGGSLRIYACHAEDRSREPSSKVLQLRQLEIDRGFNDLRYYLGFGQKVEELRSSILDFLNCAKKENKRVVGYGAAAKGNTLFNYCAIDQSLIEFVADRNPYKQGRFLPGSHIPVVPPERIRETKPDYVFIVPWNIKDEIVGQLDYIREWGGKFVIPVPHLEVV